MRAALIPHERPALAGSLWAATAAKAPHRPALNGAAEADVAVIGGGYTGLSAALHLAEAGRRVLLLEAEQPSWGASGRNGGQVNPGLKDAPGAIESHFGPVFGPRVVALAGGVGDLVFDLIARHGIECDARRAGWIRAATTERAHAALSALARDWQARGAEVAVLDAAQIEAALGSPAYAGGLIDHRAGSLHPLNYALGLAAAAERHGAQLHGDSLVTGLSDQGEAVRVETAQGHVTAEAALICTNAYTGGLAPPLGRTLVPVTSVQVATAPLGDKVLRGILPGGNAVSDSRRLMLYYRKDAQGRFLIGGRGASSDGAIALRQAALRQAAVQLFPQLAGTAWPFAWGGDVAITRDHRPGLHLLGPRVMAALGYNGRGIGMATALGRVLADWAQGRPEADLDFPVTPARPIPFHGARRIGLGAAITLYRALDRIGV